MNNPRNLPVLMYPYRRLQMVCAHCKMPVESMATWGGWNTHMCPDQLRSHAFDTFLIALLWEDKLPPRLLRKLYLQVPPWERPVLHHVLAHAGVHLEAA